MRILITRPIEDATPLAARLHGMGHQTCMAPLLSIHYLGGPPVDMTAVQALLATSANGVRAFARRSAVRSLPLFAVGDATGRVAEELGFDRVESAAGDVTALAELVGMRLKVQGGAVLHIAGTKVAGDLKGLVQRWGFQYRREVLYRALTAHRFEPEIATALQKGTLDAVVLYSPRTAQTFLDLVRAIKVQDTLGSCVAYCLSAAVAEKIRPLSWRNIQIARRPKQDALLALFEAEAS